MIAANVNVMHRMLLLIRPPFLKIIILASNPTTKNLSRNREAAS
jgi:hypothetical protein